MESSSDCEVDGDNIKKICFDQSHLNSLSIETNVYTDFIQTLFQENIKIGKITKGITNETLELYDLLIIGNPQNSYFTDIEIGSILSFIERGGSVLMFSDEGGDIANGTNLNSITKNLGFDILPNIIFDTNPDNYVEKMVWLTVRNFPDHPVNIDINHIVSASGCSFKINYNLIKKNMGTISVKPTALAPDSARMKIFDISSHKWFEEDAGGSVLSIAGHYYKGKFVILPSCSVISSINKRYGWAAKHNSRFVMNNIRWLLEKGTIEETAQIIGDKVELSIRLDQDMFNWINSMAKLGGEWADVTALINYALRLLKKRYEEKSSQMESDVQKSDEQSSDAH